MIGIQLGKNSSYSLHCKKSEYPVDLETEDAQKALQFFPITRKLVQEEMTESDFKKELNEVGFKFLKENETANTDWTCPNCNEECPLTFSECWNCGQESTSENDETKSSASVTGTTLVPVGSIFSRDHSRPQR